MIMPLVKTDAKVLIKVQQCSAVYSVYLLLSQGLFIPAISLCHGQKLVAMAFQTKMFRFELLHVGIV